VFTAVLSSDAQDALALLGKSGLVSEAYLAGGSALALYFGHRYSVDFDFFSQRLFNPEELARALTQEGKFTASLLKDVSLVGEFQGVKFSYLHYPYPLVAASVDFLGVSIAHINDIAAMKLAAIMSRGLKRDFVDVYVLVRQGLSLEQILDFYDKKYALLEQNVFGIIKSLNYFDDAENTEMPRMIAPISWSEVKRFFSSESIRLAKKYLE
jgi:Nucleotidyl transferase AbiEii toxin, Type IV TA system